MSACLLIASPQMKDPFFERTVVLVWHYDETGAMGVVVNRPLEQTLTDVLSLGETVDLSPYKTTPISWGGPVESSSGTVITRGAIEENEGWAVHDEVSVTRSEDALIRLLQGRDDLILCLGYAGWGPGQLDAELEAGGWLYTDPNPDILFKTQASDRYDKCLESLGLTPSMVWMNPVSE